MTSSDWLPSQDISAKSPIISHEVPARQSLDSARFPRTPRSAYNYKVERQPPTAEEPFEDVGLDDQKQQPPRKRGFFSKFSETQDKDTSNTAAMSRFLPGRKRGQSGQGSELGHIDHKVIVTNEHGQELK